MRLIPTKSVIIGLLLLIGAGLAYALTPKHKLAEQGLRVNLETMIPREFGQWQAEPEISPIMINPDVTDQLNKIYGQTLSRTYIDKNGNSVMLSIAYGGDQSRDMQVHRPEVCYSSQGFQISNMKKIDLKTSSGDIPAMQLTAHQGTRNEPITYWVRIGNDTVRGNLEQGIMRLKYGLTGNIPDGILFRVSTITADERHAHVIQANFISDLLKSLPPADRVKLAGANA